MNLGSRNNSFSTKLVLRMRLRCCQRCRRVRGPCRFQLAQGGIQVFEATRQIFTVVTRETTQSVCWIHTRLARTISFFAALETTRLITCGTRVIGAAVAMTESTTTVNDQSSTVVREVTTAAIASRRVHTLQLVLKMAGLLLLKFHSAFLIPHS